MENEPTPQPVEQTPTPVAVEAPAPVATPQPTTKIQTLRKYTLYVLIGGIIVSALISVVAVLIGEFSDTIVKAIWTTIITMIHAFLALLFISYSTGKSKLAASVITNTSFAIVVASFFTAIAGIWGVLSGELVERLYGTYILALITVLFVGALLDVSSRTSTLARRLAHTSTGVAIFLYSLLQPWVFSPDHNSLPDIYYRSIGATAIIFLTLVVLTIIFHNMYTAKHRASLEATQATSTPNVGVPRKKLPLWAAIVIGIILLLWGLPLVAWFLFSLQSLGN